MMSHGTPGGRFRESSLKIDREAYLDFEIRRMERERAARLADELSRGLAGYGAPSTYIDLLSGTPETDPVRSVRRQSVPLSWFKRLFH